LAAAARHAVFPGGARIRPKLCLAVARACGEADTALAEAAAAGIELLHCASLVHDDLPCFDDAALRRGQPSVHMAFGERLAILAGDALIVLSFQAVAQSGTRHLDRIAPVIMLMGRAAGMPRGMAAGQAWECESDIVLSDYHRAKTGSLFATASMVGAAASGRPIEPWQQLGALLGEAYQVADDLRDVAADAAELGKPTGKDATLGRPNAAAMLGIDEAIRRLERLVQEAIASIPACPGAEELRAQVKAQAARFVPKSLARRAA
jgi:geranylgeranyl diphosphate synthase type II